MKINTVKWNSKRVFVGVMCLSLMLQCAFAFSSMDMYHPDELIQCLEQAHKNVFGFGQTAWEFDVGLRNFIAIRLVTAVVKCSTWLPFQSPLSYLYLTKLMMLILFNVGMYGLYRYVKKSQVGLFLFGLLMLYWPFLRFGYRTLSETFSIPFIIWGVLLLREKTEKSAFWAGISFGLSVIFRYGSGVLVAFVVLEYFIKRQWKLCVRFLMGGGLMAIVLGMDDWVKWGRPFHSIYEYFSFNIVAGKSSGFGVEPWHDYIVDLSVFFPIAIVGVVLFCLRKDRLLQLFQSRPFLLAIGYVAVFSLVGHKEFRFVIPIIPLVVMGFSDAVSDYSVSKTKKTTGIAVFCLIILVSQAYVLNKKIFSFPRTGGQYMWAVSQSANPNFTGLLVLGNIYMGSYSYCHKNVPILSAKLNQNDIDRVCENTPTLSHVLLLKTVDSKEVESVLLENGFVIFQKDAQVIYFKKRNLYN